MAQTGGLAAVLDDPAVQKWLVRLSPADQAKLADRLPVFVWGLDAMTEHTVCCLARHVPCPPGHPRPR